MGWGIISECRDDGRLGRINYAGGVAELFQPRCTPIVVSVIFTTLCIVGALLSQLSGIEWLNYPNLSLPSHHLAKPHKRDKRWLYVCERGPLDTPSQTLETSGPVGCLLD